MENNTIIDHDKNKVGAWPVREYRCKDCKQIHSYKRTWGDIPKRCSICDGLLRRDWSEGGLPVIQTKTELREVRFKLEDEVRDGKRPRAIDEEEHSICTL